MKTRVKTRKPVKLRHGIGGSPWCALATAISAVLGLVAQPALAGDILRGGSSVGAKPGNSAAGGPTSAAAAQATANARDILVRNTQTINSMRVLQKNARELARRGPNHLGLDPNHPGLRLPNVPNGLLVGGLQVAPGVPVNLSSVQAGENASLWRGAQLPKETKSAGQTTVGITQTQSQAVLTWKTFNVGKETTVNFNQSKGTQKDGSNNWIAFNRVLDPTGVPSQILGSIKGQGSVYLINQNGIIFGGSSQVRLHSFVASALPINDNLLNRGLLNNPDAQFLFSALALPAGGNGTPAFTPEAPLTPSGRPGDVTVQAGAILRSPSNEAKAGGRVMLVGPNVNNSGTISTPDGQTILAAGLQVGLSAHAGSDPSLRGLDVFVGAVARPNEGTFAGVATNTGTIETARASVIMVGKSVNQFGVIQSTTSVSLNGRVDLMASYDAISNPATSDSASQTQALFLNRATGAVTLGQESVTQILPDLESSETVVGSTLALKSQINLEGLTIHLDHDSTVLAPGAQINLRAGQWLFSQGQSPPYSFVSSAGQIYLEAGSTISAAGSIGSSAPLANNIVSVELRGSELADSPLQRTGVLRGSTIQIDVRESGSYNGFAWVGTPLANAAGYVGLVQRKVGELTISGGTVKLSAGESVILREGAKIDVSGGGVDYQGGMVQTTRLVQGSRLLDISQATPDQLYDGVYSGTFTANHPKYGLSETFRNSLAMDGLHYEPGYTFGGDGGSISITAPAVALDGELLGNTIAGLRQRVVLPHPSSLSLVFLKQESVGPRYQTFSPTPPKIVFQQDSSQTAPEAFGLDGNGNPLPLSSVRQETVLLSPQLLSARGFGNLTIDNSDGEILVPKGVNLNGQVGGLLILNGANLQVDGSITLAGGTLSLMAHDISPRTVQDLLADPNGAQTPAANPNRGRLALGASGSLSTAGLLVDDRNGMASPGEGPMMLAGGAISLTGYNVELEEGSVIDVSGGASVSSSGKRTYGNAGSISISGGQAAPVSVDSVLAAVVGGRLQLGSTLLGFSGAKGGSLSVLAPLIQIGGRAQNPDTLLLDPEFFSQGGFSTFNLKGFGASDPGAGDFLPGVLIAPGTEITPQAQSLVLMSDFFGSGLTLTAINKPVGYRSPVSLNFSAVGVRDSFTRLTIFRGDLVYGAGARITTDPLGTVNFTGETATVLGSVFAPGGAISISGGKDSNSVFLDQAQSLQKALTTVVIGSHSVLSAAGTTLRSADVRGFRTGLVLAGGKISLSGNIVAAAGSRLDVSGASDQLDLRAGYALWEREPLMAGSFLGSVIKPIQIESGGGEIVLTGGQQLLVDSTLLGRAGGPSALGGRLTVSSGRFLPIGDSTLQTPLDVTLTVNQAGRSIPSAFAHPRVGQAVVDSAGLGLSAGHLNVGSFAEGGFDSASLLGSVKFEGNVRIRLPGSLTIATGGVIFGQGAVRLSAPHVSVGTAFRSPFAPEEVRSPFLQGSTPFNFDPTYGTGSLTVIAELIDVGNLSLQGMGRANLIARQGDIRGDGTFNVAGAIRLEAGQIYPPTAVTFAIAASDYSLNSTLHPGSVTILKSGFRPLPFSVGGNLNIQASIIDQRGTLRAPLGSITLGWDGTGTGPIDLITGKSVAVTQQLTLGRGSLTSISGIDPFTGRGALLPYGLNLNGISWIDPVGADITAVGAPAKGISISAANITDVAGSLVDIRGGGDLFAYRWVPGNGGSTDLLSSISSFAILPGYGADYAPYAPFAQASQSGNLGTDPGYVNGSLHAGDQVYLKASDGLKAGFYTLLPARYALLPGAFLVTPKSGIPGQAVQLADGSSLVSGYRSAAGQSGQPVAGLFEVASGLVVRERSQYSEYSANRALAEGPAKLGLAIPRLPRDGGQLSFSASQALILKGRVAAQAPSSGRGGLVDISSSLDIRVTGPGVTAGAGELVLNAGDLSRFGAESLLIGGYRKLTAAGTTVTVRSVNLTLDNAGTALRVPEVILVAKQNLNMAAGAQIEQSGQIVGRSELLLLGDSAIAGSGNGALVMVSSDPGAGIVRSGNTLVTGANLTIGEGVQFSGTSLVLDSTYAGTLAATAALDGRTISLNSGQISFQLEPSAVPLPTFGLVLAGNALQSLQSADSLSFLSYSSIDIYGAGEVSANRRLALHAAELRGFDTGAGVAQFSAGTIQLDNSPKGTLPGSLGVGSGTLRFSATQIGIGSNQMKLDQFAVVDLVASNQIAGTGVGGLSTQGALTATTPVFSAARAAVQTYTAGGALVLNASSGQSTAAGGLGASVSFTGTSVSIANKILLPSGTLNLRATAGDVTVGGNLEVGGTVRHFYDVDRYTGAGKVTLNSETGSVHLLAAGRISVAAMAEGGDAGTLIVSAPLGAFTSDGTLAGQAGSSGIGGSFSLDVNTLLGGSLSQVGSKLDAGGFTESRSVRLRSGNLLVDGIERARTLRFSADNGSLTVSGTLDASGLTGGQIALSAHGSLVLLSGSLLNVAGEHFSNAGKGGEISLEAGSQTNGVIDGSAVLQMDSGSEINLTVADQTALSANQGRFAGTLHLRAPQSAGGIQMTALNSTFTAPSSGLIAPSSVVIEGYELFTPVNGLLSSAVQLAVKSSGNNFSANSAAILSTLLANNAGIASVVTLVPGAELINLSGDLTLGTSNSTSSSDWDLSTFRFGTNLVPGVLTLRAQGNLVFFNSLSDGFTSGVYTADLLNSNGALPTNAQSWSYRLTAGADFGAADYQRVLSSSTGSLQLGKDGGTNIANPFGANGLTRNAIGVNGERYQTIRTGTGGIEIATAGDVQLLNQFATIYTAGAKVSNPTSVLGVNDFELPILSLLGGQGPSLGATQQNPLYAVQYALAGGNVSINAAGNINHLTKNTAGQYIADSEREMPSNWLYRRGSVDPTTGMFAPTKWGDIASTTWWVDYSNFFEGVGALGGGNVTMVAGRDIANVDAVVPTNARMAKGMPNAANLLELGGGDLTVRAGGNIDGGVYYVERGQGTLNAGDTIRTNSTRSPSLTILKLPADVQAPETWLPTTLFLGKGTFEVAALGDVLLGPVANPFLLPVGINNTFWDKSYFSTYGADSAVNVSSLGGSVTWRTRATLAAASGTTPLLQAWYERELLLVTAGQFSASYYQPWLRLSETQINPFRRMMGLMPSTLRATAFSGNVNLAGGLTLSPSSNGTVELVAAGSINGLTPNGLSSSLLSGQTVRAWEAATINLSDADPSSIPGVGSPFGYQTISGIATTPSRTTQDNFLAVVDNLFAETGSTQGSAAVLQTKLALHASNILHGADFDPIHLYTLAGDISGLTIYSAKAARIVAGQDLSDIGLYLQNTREDDLSVVTAGRDIIAYAPNSQLRIAAQASGNALTAGSKPLSGDIQISGPGTLEVLAGRNLDLGIGPNNSDGTGVGITSIGNARNPALPTTGANIFAGAGIGLSTGLSGSNLDVSGFLGSLDAATIGAYLSELNIRAERSGPGNAAELNALSPDQQAHYALDMFYLALRDAGRNFPATGDYATGFAAIETLFGSSSRSGDILLTSREIKTRSGGDINLFAPGGELTVGFDVSGTQALDQGILTESGGNISIFTHGSVNVGTSRIFTLRGGDEVLWSSTGDIAAGASSKTVQSAPPTRVIVDAQTADVKTDLAGLATGGGIGVLATVANVTPGNIALIAPTGTVDAGDAGVRASGNITVAAQTVLNASNISASGASSGVPAAAPAMAAPSLGGLNSAASTTNTAASASNEAARQSRNGPAETEAAPSSINVEVLGFGGTESTPSSDEEELKRKKRALNLELER